MRCKVEFNIIEINKNNNINDIKDSINIIMNKLIVKMFVNLQ